MSGSGNDCLSRGGQHKGCPPRLGMSLWQRSTQRAVSDEVVPFLLDDVEIAEPLDIGTIGPDVGTEVEVALITEVGVDEEDVRQARCPVIDELGIRHLVLDIDVLERAGRIGVIVYPRTCQEGKGGSGTG